MAGGFARTLAPPETAIWSAGSAPSRVNPDAVEVMREVGIDISGQRSKSVEEVCPVFPVAVERIHWPLKDPAAAPGGEDEVRERFRRVRDQLRTRIEGLFRPAAAQR